MGALPALLPLVLLFGSPVVDTAVGARAEVGAGLVPIVPEEAASPAVQTTLNARVGLRAQSDTTRFIFRTGPRVYSLLPNSAALDRPLFFYVADASYETQLLPRLSLAWAADGGAGEIAYASLDRLLPPGTGAIQSAVIPVALVNSTANLTYVTERTHSFRLLVGLSGQKSLDDALAPDELPTLPTFTSVSGEAQSIHRLSRRDDLTFVAAMETYIAEIEGTSYRTGAGARYQHTVSRRQSVGAEAGGEWIHTSVDGNNYALPHGLLLHSFSGEDFSIRSSGGIRGFFDRVEFTYTPQALLRSDAELHWSPTLHSGLSVFGSTALTRALGPNSLFATYIGLEQPNRYALSANSDLLFGVRASLRGPYLSDFTVDESQGQVLGFVGIDWSEGSDRQHGEFIR